MSNINDKVEYEFTGSFTEEAKSNFLKFIEELQENDQNCSVTNHTNHSNHSNW